MLPRLPSRLPTALAALAVGAALAVAPATPTSAADGYPDVVPLPGEFRPEGIAGGPGDVFFAGSRPGPAGGAVYRGDLRTGTGSVLVPAQPGGASIGMQYDDRTGLLWVAGGGTGALTAYDGASGERVARYVLPSASAVFVNDVDISRDGVYATDSRNARLLVVPTKDGTPPGRSRVLALRGDWSQSAEGNNANGIRALPDGDLLVVDQGSLLRVDPHNGKADLLERTGGPALTNGDGLELDGRRLFVVHGDGTDSVSVVTLAPDARSYAVTGRLTKDLPEEDDLERPTTALFEGGSLWVVNGKFATPDAQDDEVVRLVP